MKIAVSVTAIMQGKRGFTIFNEGDPHKEELIVGVCFLTGLDCLFMWRAKKAFYSRNTYDG